eukprot:7509471-Alexandrium_andersonii.AAC.1
MPTRRLEGSRASAGPAPAPVPPPPAPETREEPEPGQPSGYIPVPVPLASPGWAKSIHGAGAAFRPGVRAPKH